MPALTTHAPLTKEQELHWLALKMTPGLGTRTAYQLIQKLRTPEAIFRSSTSELEAHGLPRGIAQSVASGCAFEDAADQHNKLAEFGSTLIPITAPQYPDRLREIYDPPVLLFARGRLELLDTLMIAVVGTRRPTRYGIAASEKLSGDLAAAGLTIVSGMARGIDTAAHTAALQVNGGTIAVFGCGVDLVYPAENRKLAATLAEKGLVLSEFPMGAPPYPQNFPIRNRIVSGMSIGVLVVEGAQYSGSAITARLAMDQQREVFAVPGNITSKMSWGPNLLIKQGAKLVQEWNDVVVELSPEDRRRLVTEGQPSLQQDVSKQQDTAEEEIPLNKMAAEIVSRLRVDEAMHLDRLVESLEHFSSSEIIAALFELELRGSVRQLPGRKFVRVSW
ncbi:MAG TPA: DNA-processing protein DprA [Bryobacteraceae bacterium]|nr:DNA-processing protein DprA [Bryobacteraceae bacterium]